MHALLYRAMEEGVSPFLVLFFICNQSVVAGEPLTTLANFLGKVEICYVSLISPRYES